MNITITSTTSRADFKKEVQQYFTALINHGKRTIISKIPELVDRSSPEVIQDVLVVYKGASPPLREIAYITSPTSNTLTIKLIEKNQNDLWQATEDALLATDIPLFVHDYRPEYFEVTFPKTLNKNRAFSTKLKKYWQHVEQDLQEAYTSLQEYIHRSDIAEKQKNHFLDDLENIFIATHHELLTLLQTKLNLLESHE